jgi:hypothetical protein
MYDAYTTAFPSKSTKFNDDTPALTDICVREFRSEESIKACMGYYDPWALYKFLKSKSKKGPFTLLQLAPFILHRNPITGIAYRAAERKEYLPILMWLHWYCHSKYFIGSPFWDWDIVFVKAVNLNRYDILKWAKEKTDIDICALAVKYGSIQVLEWYGRNGGELSVDVGAMAMRSKNPHVMIPWARDNGFPWDVTLCSNAAMNGELYALQLAHQYGCPWDGKTCSNAALRGDLEMLKWAHDKGCPWDATTCSNAALSGNFELLKWAHDNGCPWDATTCSNAALRGDFEMLKWAHMKGCPWDAYTVINAKKMKHWDIYRWVRSKGCPYDKKKTTKQR